MNQLTAVKIENSSDTSYRLNRVEKKVLLREFPYSSLYKVTIDGNVLIYKIIRENKNINFDTVLKSYMNLPLYRDIESLVKIYDFHKAADNSTFEILMEYLDGYYDVQEVEQTKKIDHAEQIYSIFSEILDKGILPADSGIANFMTDGTSVKMIDLDVMLQWREDLYCNTTHFISKIKEFKIWCPEASTFMDNLIARVVEERKRFFIPYNPMTQKLLEDGEKVLSEIQDPQSALKLFNQALRLSPHSAAVLNNLAVVNWELCNTQESLNYIKSAVEIEPENETYFANMIDILSAMGKADEAGNKSLEYDNYVKNISPGLKYEYLYVNTEEQKLQKEISDYTYPSNYAYDIKTLKPIGILEQRIEYILNYAPDLFEPCDNFLSVGSSLGYMLLLHSFHAQKCTGIEPDIKANEIVTKVMKYRNIKNITLHPGTFLDFQKDEIYDLIWMGNVFQYMYVDFEWDVAAQLAKISNGKCVVEAPFEGGYLRTQKQYNSTWGNERLMKNYSLERFKNEMGRYFDLISVGPSGTDPVNRNLVVMKRNNTPV